MTLILSLLDTPAFGGAEQYLLQHLYELQKNKQYHVVLATNRDTVKARVADDGNPIEVIHLPYRLDAIGNWKGLVKYFVHAPIALMWFLKTLSTYAHKYSNIIVYMPGFSDRMLFSPFIKWQGHRLVWLEFVPLRPLFKRNWGFPKLLYAIGRPFPDKVITISQYTKACMLRDTTMPDEKIEIVFPTTPMISEKKLAVYRKQGKEWRQQKKLVNKKLITFVGRLATEKEIDLLITAFAKVAIKNKDAQLVIVGDGPERAQYEQLVKKLRLHNRVLFAGFVTEEEKRSILATSELFVFPSAWELEGFGMTTIEAMMMEVAVITSGAGPQAEIVIDGKTGVYFRPHSATALAKAISMSLATPALMKQIARDARLSLLNTQHSHISL